MEKVNEQMNNEVNKLPSKIPFFQKLKMEIAKRRGKTTKCILADIDENTGEYKNMKLEYISFPIENKRLNKKMVEKCVGIEINDENLVDVKDILYLKNLQELVFGKGVKHVQWSKPESHFQNDERYNISQERDFMERQARPRRIIFSNDVQDIYTNGASRLGNNVCELEKIEFGDNIKTIPKAMLYGAIKLKNIKFPRKLEKIESEAFSGCINLENLDLPETCESIGDYAFNYCKEMKTIDAMGKIKSLGKGAFGYCLNLESAYIYGDGLIIKDECFKNCSHLTDVILPANSTISQSAFKGTGDAEITFVGRPKEENKEIEEELSTYRNVEQEEKMPNIENQERE